MVFHPFLEKKSISPYLSFLSDRTQGQAQNFLKSLTSISAFICTKSFSWKHPQTAKEMADLSFISLIPFSPWWV
jgi:hypothetical protein